MFVADKVATPVLEIMLLAMKALVLVRIVLTAAAPAPLTDTPAVPPKPAAIEAATDTALIVALVSEVRLTAPVLVNPFAAFLMDASTSLEIKFWAIDTPIETETPAVPPKEAATEAAPASAVIVELSLALKVAAVD